MFTEKIRNDNNNISTEILVEEWQKTKDKKILQEIINRHIKLIERIAINYQVQNLSKHDLVAEGILGLIHGLEKFQVNKKVKFSTYAFYWIKSKISLYSWKMRNLIHISFSTKNSFIYSIMKQIKEDKISYQDAIKTISEKQNMLNDETQYYLGVLSQKMVSLNSKFTAENETEENSWENLITNDENQDMLDEIEIKDLMSLVEECLLSFNEKQKFIINNRWLTNKPLTMQEIAKKVHMSLEGIRQMERRTLNELREHLTSRLYHGNNHISAAALRFILLLNIFLEK